MTAPRLAFLLLLTLALAPALLRRRLELPPPPRDCAPAGFGVPPRHWLGCATDRGPPRALSGDERLVLGLPLDPNTASAAELAFVPGVGRRLAGEIVRDRERSGPYRSVEDLLRVRGLGPKRLAQAAPALTPTRAP